MSQGVKEHIGKDSTIMFNSLGCVFSNVSRQECVQSLISTLELSDTDLSTMPPEIFLKLEDAFTKSNFTRVKTLKKKKRTKIGKYIQKNSQHLQSYVELTLSYTVRGVNWYFLER